MKTNDTYSTFDNNFWTQDHRLASTSEVKKLLESPKILLKELDEIIKLKPSLNLEKIKYILLNITIFTREIKNIDEYQNKILNIYLDTLSPKDKVALCMNLSDEKMCENIIKRYYKEMKKEIRYTHYIVTRDDEDDMINFDSKEIIDRIRSKHQNIILKYKNYQLGFFELKSSVLKIFYKYFENDIKCFDAFRKINFIQFAFSRTLEPDVAFYFFQEGIKNKINLDELDHLEILEYKNVKLTNELPNYVWIRTLKNQKLLKFLLEPNPNTSFYMLLEYEKTFQDAFLEFLKENVFSKINITKIASIYSIEYLSAIDKLSKESYNDNKNNYLFLLCFQIFLKEFLKKYEDELTNLDIEYLIRIFRRGIQRNSIYIILKIKNKKNLIHNYKSNDILLNPDMIGIKHINNYNVKQYRKIKELLNSKTKTDENNEYIIISLSLLGYEVTKKLIEYSKIKWKEIIENIKEKPDNFCEAFKKFVSRKNDKSNILEEYSSAAYLEAFEKLLAAGKKPTLNNMNKIIKAIKSLLVPYNEHIEENLEKLDNVAKGEPFLEKINGIKLYEEYRRRINSSIPDYYGKYNELEYGFVNLHDRKIISNGIGNYLLPNNKKASSCLTPNGKAKTCLYHGAVNPNGRFFKITRDQKIVAYSWVWRCGDVLCFDNIELTDEIEKIDDYEKTIYEIYLQTAKYLTEITKKEPNKGIKLVLIGRNKIDIKNKYIDNLESLKNLSSNLFKPNSNNEEELYLKDSSENQVILYGKYNNTLDTKDVEPIYLYQRPAIENIKNIDESILDQRINAIYYDYCLQHSIKYHKIKNVYESGYLGEDWFVGTKKDGKLDFFYYENDKRLFYEVKQCLKSNQKIEIKQPNIYLPKYNVERILDQKNIDINDSKITTYLNNLSTHDYKIPTSYYSHTTQDIESLNSIFRDGAITSAYLGNRSSGGGTNGMYYICIAKMGTELHNAYHRTGTIILDNNMQIFEASAEKLPQNMMRVFSDTSYPIRGIFNNDECQVRDIITKDHFDSLLALNDNNISLAQIILLNEIYDLNLPIVLEPTMSKIDTNYIKKYIKIK